MSLPKSIRIIVDESNPHAASETGAWAVGHLVDSLARKGISRGEADQGFTVTIGTADDTLKNAESFSISRSGNELLVRAADARGLVYALTELADRVGRAEDDLFGNGFPLTGRPATRIRSITRLFCNEREDKAWFHDKSHWIDYLTMLATNRFNRFSLTLGIQYDYPYHNHLISDVYLHFPYPYLVDLPEHGIKVLELSDAERETNLEMLKFIGREAARRGLDFQLGLWTQRYDFDDVPNANYTIVGATDQNIAPYCRDAIAVLLREVPQITGLTFRIHVEGGVSEGDYDFWRTAFDGIKSAGRPIEIDMHAKGLDETTLNVALETGMPVAASPKYLAEHIGLSYHPSAIREREYPPVKEVTNREKLSVGSRRFLRQSYGDLLPKDKRWKVIFRVWPGTQRVLAWGDPELAAGYGRSASFCGADGIEWMEPLSMKGRQGSGLPGGRALYKDFALTQRLDWQKYVYQYRLWGRLSYDPDAGTEQDAAYLKAECGDASELVGEALAAASKILPLVTQTHGPSIANNNYWVENYTNLALVGDNPVRPFGGDMDGPLRFGNAPTFDPLLFATAREFIEALIADEPVHRYTPLDVADWLSAAAETVEMAAIRAKSCYDLYHPAVQRLLIDAQVAAALGRFFAEKQRGACWAELFIATGVADARHKALHHLRGARAAWKAAADLTRDVYQDDLTFGPGAHMRGAWASRLGDIDREVKDLSAYRQSHDEEARRDPATAERVGKALSAWRPARQYKAKATAPSAFVRGEAVRIDVPAESGRQFRLHYRRVNQAERWRSLDMPASGGVAGAEIPADYTDSEFHLQYLVTAVDDSGLSVFPGFDASLANQPYGVILQR
jgi:hypothetical protein